MAFSALYGRNSFASPLSHDLSLTPTPPDLATPTLTTWQTYQTRYEFPKRKLLVKRMFSQREFKSSINSEERHQEARWESFILLFELYRCQFTPSLVVVCHWGQPGSTMDAFYVQRNQQSQMMKSSHDWANNCVVLCQQLCDQYQAIGLLAAHHLDGHIPMKSPQNCQPPVATLPFVVVRACVVVASVREGLNRQSRVTHAPPPPAATAPCVSHSALGKEL